MSDEQRDELHELSGLYAVDALEPEDRARFEEHLATCPSCRQEVDSFRETASYLAEDDVPPPASMRESVLSQLDVTPQDVPVEAAADDGPAAVTDGSTDAGDNPDTGTLPEADSGVTAESSAPVTPLRPRRWRGRLLAGVAGVAVAASLGVFALVERPWEPDEPVVPPEQQVIAAEDAQRFEGASTEDGLAVVSSPSRGQAVLEASDLEQPPEGHTYQAWYLHEGADPVSAGVLPDEAEREDMILLEGDPEGATGVALTVEPEGGSEQPTTEPQPSHVIELS